MRIRVNGDELETTAKTISEVLSDLKIVPGRVAVEVNLKVIKRADFDSYMMKDGDIVEIVNFVGGG